MSAPKKLIVVLFLLVLLASLGLLVFYSYQKRSGKFPTQPKTQTEFLSGKIALNIEDEAKWNSFLADMCGCENGDFTVFESLSSKVSYQAKSVRLVISDNRRKNSLSRPLSGHVGSETLYTYDYFFDETVKEAIVILNFPGDADEDTVHNAVVLTIYVLFKGEPYSAYDAKVAFYKSLVDIGLDYEKL